MSGAALEFHRMISFFLRLSANSNKNPIGNGVSGFRRRPFAFAARAIESMGYFVGIWHMLVSARPIKYECIRNNKKIISAAHSIEMIGTTGVARSPIHPAKDRSFSAIFD